MMNKEFECAANSFRRWVTLPKDEWYTSSLSSLIEDKDFLDNLLAYSVISNRRDWVKGVLSCGANVNSRLEHGYTSLHEAYEQGHKEIASFLIENGASVAIKNSWGQTPIDIKNLHEV